MYQHQNVLCHSSQNYASEASVKWECNILRQKWKKKLQKLMNQPYVQLKFYLSRIECPTKTIFLA
jgi:hypothetical protein